MLSVHYYCACMLSHFSHVRLCATHELQPTKVPLSMEFSKQENWSGLLCSPGDLPDPRIEPVSLRSILQGQADSLLLAPPGKSHYYCNRCNFSNYCPLTLRLHILLHLTFAGLSTIF